MAGRTVGVLVAAVVLIAVPTAFDILAPELGSWPVWTRAVLLAVWVGGAAVTTVKAIRRDESLDRLVDVLAVEPPATDMLVDAEEASPDDYQSVAAIALVEHLLESRWPGLRSDQELTVYVFDEDRRVLVAEYPLDIEEPGAKEFGPGKGATGTAWTEGELTVVEGDDVSNAAYGLTERQQRLFRRYRSVAAHPIVVNGARIGVVTAISRRQDGYWDDERTRGALGTLAAAVGVLILGAAIDEPDRDEPPALASDKAPEADGAVDGGATDEGPDGGSTGTIERPGEDAR